MQIVMPRGELQVHVAKDNGILRDGVVERPMWRSIATWKAYGIGAGKTVQLKIFLLGVTTKLQ